MKSKWKIVIMLVILFSLIIVPKMIFSNYGIHDSFIYSNSSLAETAINEEQLESYPYVNDVNTINRHANGWSSRWVVTASIASLSMVTGISPRDLQTIPICALGILIMAYLVASKLTKDKRLAIAYTLLMALDPTVNSLTNSTYIQGWGFIFYFMLIYTVIVIVEKKYYMAYKEKQHYRPLALFGGLAALSLVMMHYTYYSAMIYGVILLASVSGGIFLMNSSTEKLNLKRVILFALLMVAAFIVVAMVEDTVMFALGQYGGSVGSFFRYIGDIVLTFLGIGTSSNGNTGLSVSGGLKFYIGLISYVLIFIPILLVGFAWLKKLLKQKEMPSMRWEDIIVASFLVTGVVNLVIYTGLGLVDLKYFIMFYSLTALYLVKRVRKLPININWLKTIKIPKRQIFTYILIILFMMKFIVYMGPIMADDTSRENNQLQWLADNGLGRNTETIADLQISGDIMLMNAENDNLNFNSYIFSDLYLDRSLGGNISSFERMNEDIDFIVMTEANNNGHFSIGNWETWDAESNPENIMGNYHFAQRVYSSSEITIWHMSMENI